MKMKYIYLWLFAVSLTAVFTACSHDEEDRLYTELSLDEPRYKLGNNEGDSVEIAVVTEGKALSTLKIPYRLSSTTGAKLDEDFTISDTVFTLQKGDSVAYLKVFRKRVTSEKAFLLTLKPTEGVKLGALNYIQVDLIGSNAYTFVDPTTELALSKDCKVRLETATGQRFVFTKKTRLDVDVDPSSTAVEGEHFMFKDGVKKAVFNRNQNIGTVSIVFLKLEKGKDHIVLRLSESNKFVPGANPAIDVHIVGPTDFSGTWQFQGVSNDRWWRNSMGADPAYLVDTVKTDRIILAGDPLVGFNFTPQLTGKLKNYFTTACYAAFKAERENYQQEAGGWPPPLLSLAEYEFETVNVAFSDAVNITRKALVGLRIFKDAKRNRVLEVNVYDFEPADPHWEQAFKSMKYGLSEPPYFLDGPLRLQFTEVK